MKHPFVGAAWFLLLLAATALGADDGKEIPAVKRRNNLMADLAEASSLSKDNNVIRFARPSPGWIFISASCQGPGDIKITLDPPSGHQPVMWHTAESKHPDEAFRWVPAGEHRLLVDCTDENRVEKLIVRAVPELIHCGLGFNSAIKSYGLYDLEFLKRDILPNVTTLMVPHNIALPPATIDLWHRQGKRFVAEVGVPAQPATADECFRHWATFYDNAPFLDGIIINEFIVNNFTPPGTVLSPERQQRFEQEQARYRLYEQAIKTLRADDRYKHKSLYAYVGGSGKKLNQEVIGPTFIRTLLDSGCRIALERYIFEVSSPQKSADALTAFVEGMADWEAKEPGVKRQMTIAFGLFSMPPGGINKQPNVDYHVWMDQQMHEVANNPALADLAGLEWWTTTLADEETVRFVGKLYRHYAIEGHTELLTRDPLFLSHVENADFEKGLDGWHLHPAEEGTILPKSFPRYGRIEGRFMGLGRPADPEHIGDTFLWMKRSPRGPNTFSQTIKNLEPGRLYSLKMFSCDYQDLVNPQKKTEEEASKFLGRVELAGVEVDTKRSFIERYASNPEPPIPVWITYHWKVFRAKTATATLTVSDWHTTEPTGPFGQEQTFNFVEIQPYHE